MKKQINLCVLMALTLVALILIPSCKKSSSGTPGTPSSYKIKTLISSVNQGGSITGDTISFVYDGTGRLISDAGSIAETIVYSGSSFIITTSYYPNPYNGTLNAQGLASSTSTASIPVGATLTNTFNYDNNGFCIGGNDLTNGSPTDTFVMTYADSNLVRYTEGTNVFNYTYSSTREYRDYGFSGLFNTIPSYAWSGTAFGRNSKFLMSSSTDQTGLVTNFTYTFDSYGRVVTETQTSSASVTSLRFTYY